MRARDGVRHRAARRARSSARAATPAARRGRSSGRSSAGSTSPACNVEDLELATVPLTRFQVRNEPRRRAASRCGSRPATPTASRSASSTPTAATSTRRRSARSSGCSTARTSGARSPATSATSCSRRARSSSTPPRSSAASTPSGVRQRAFKVVLDYSFGAASIVMPNVLAKLGAEVLAVNPFASTRRRRRPSRIRDAQVARSPTSCARRAATSGSCSIPTASSRRSSTTPGTSLEPEQALLALVALVARGGARARASRCRCRSASEAERDRSASDGARSCGRSSRRRASWRSRPARDVDFAASHDGGFIWPDFLPAYDAAATLVKLLDLLAAVDRPLSSVVARRCRDRTSRTRRRRRRGSARAR